MKAEKDTFPIKISCRPDTADTALKNYAVCVQFMVQWLQYNQTEKCDSEYLMDEFRDNVTAGLAGPVGKVH